MSKAPQPWRTRAGNQTQVAWHQGATWVFLKTLRHPLLMFSSAWHLVGIQKFWNDCWTPTISPAVFARSPLGSISAASEMYVLVWKKKNEITHLSPVFRNTREHQCHSFQGVGRQREGQWGWWEKRRHIQQAASTSWSSEWKEYLTVRFWCFYPHIVLWKFSII